MRFLWMISLSLLLLLLGCTPPKDPVRPPPRGASQPTLPAPRESIIRIPLSMSLQELQENTHDQIPQVLLEETGQEISKGVLVDWTVSRQGGVTLSRWNDRQVRLVVPLQITARAYTARQAERKERRDGEERGATMTAQLLLNADLTLDIHEDWHLIPVAEVSYTWAETPVLQIGPLRLDITRAVDEKLTQKLPGIAERIEARMRERDRLPERIALLWEQLSLPRALPRPEGAWLVVEPTALTVSTPRVGEDALHMIAGLRGQISILLEAPPPRAALPPIPRRAPSIDIGEGLRLQVSAQLAWSHLSAQATRMLAGKSWPLEVAGQQAGTFTVTEAELYPTGEHVAVGLGYTATSPLWSTDGTLWLTGRPALDIAAQSFHIEDFDYTIETWDLAVAGVNLDAIREPLLEQLSEELRFPFGALIAEKQAEANDQLDHIVLARGAVLTARLDAISVHRVALTDEALVLRAELQGTAQLQLPPPPEPTPRP